MNPCTDELNTIDLRIKVLDLAKQVVMSKDNVTIVIDATVYYKINEAKNSYYRMNQIQQAVT